MFVCEVNDIDIRKKDRHSFLLRFLEIYLLLVVRIRLCSKVHHVWGEQVVDSIIAMGDLPR